MTSRRRLVVVGNGMAGARFVEELLARGGGERFAITVFGDEPHGNYNRILLSSVLAGGHRADDIFINPMAWYRANGVTLHAGVRVEAIDRAARSVRGGNGLVEPYDELVLATGSSAVVPPIHGVFAGGAFVPRVFLFRTLDDCRAILAGAAASRRAAVIGGGLLGLEAASGLFNRGIETHVVHLRPHLMEGQLDADAGAVLRRQLERKGLHVHLERSTAAVLSDSSGVSGLVFRDGSKLECDLVVIAAGVRPNVDLARQAGLTVAHGIVVGDDLACAGADHVSAVGECAEHRGTVCGLVAPAWEQARVLAERLSGRHPEASYEGSRIYTKLKVAGVELAVMGTKEPLEEEDEVVSYAEPARGIYKKLIVRNDRLAGAILMGDGVVVPSLIQAFVEAKSLAAHRPALLFPLAADDRAARLPEAVADSARICDCNAVTKAAIVEAVLAGARSVGAVSERTRACTGCGSCRPEVERIVQLACEGLEAPAKLAAPEPAPPAAEVAVPPTGTFAVTLNKIERIKREKNGLEIVDEVPRFAREGWQAIPEADRERLKWAGVFFRRQTPGHFMMRLRMSNGFANAAQLRVLADISREVGPGYLDITTRQQVQLRGFGIEQVPALWDRLEGVGLVSLQTGMDNIRNVIGCPLAGLTPHEVVDASGVVRQFTSMFLRNRAFTDLPRKFNVAISGCREHCVHAETQDVALTPAFSDGEGTAVAGFNVAVGGKIGSGGYRVASPLDVFVEPAGAAALCAEIALIFRDHGPRAARNRARLAFLVEEWGAARFRRELQDRLGRPLPPAGRDARTPRGADHLGLTRQKQAGYTAVGLAVPVGRISSEQLHEVARLAEDYGSGDVRITTGQNVIVPNVPDARLEAMIAEPLLQTLRHDPPGAIRGLVSCTGIDYCHFALIETKAIAARTADYLAARLPHGRLLSMHWSGCPAGCGNHAAADIGLLGKNIRVDGELVDAVDVFVGGAAGPQARPGTRLLEDVPCDELPQVLEQLIPYISRKGGPGAAPTLRPAAAAPQVAGAGA